jgi:hypothetical protein
MAVPMPILEMEEAQHVAVPSTSTAVSRPHNQDDDDLKPACKEEARATQKSQKKD